MRLVCDELTGSRRCTAADPQITRNDNFYYVPMEVDYAIKGKKSENCEGIVDSIVGTHRLAA